MQNRGLQKALVAVVLAVWVTSFFLPSLYLNGPVNPGWKACAISATLLFTLEKNALGMHLYFGSFWLANFFMLGSPLALRRARRGKAAVFLALMAAWDLLTLSYAGYDWWTSKHFETVRMGFWVWEATLWAMTVLLWTSRRFRTSP